MARRDVGKQNKEQRQKRIDEQRQKRIDKQRQKRMEEDAIALEELVRKNKKRMMPLQSSL